MQAQAPQKPDRVNCFKPIIGCLFGPILLVICVLGCACACVASISLGSPDPLYDEDFEPSSAQAQNYENSVTQALQNPQNGQFTLRFTDKEFASWLNLNYEALFRTYDVADEEQIERIDPIFQVEFDNQQVRVYAGQDWLFLTMGMLVVAEIGPPLGEFTPELLDIDIVKVQIGLFEANDVNSTQLEQRLVRILTDRIDAYVTDASVQSVEIQTVDIQDGEMTITGQITP